MKNSSKFKSCKQWFMSAAVAAVTLSSSHLASAQNTDTGPLKDVVALGDWDYTQLGNKWSAEEIIDTEVFGVGGDEIGSVENLLINSKGKVVAVIAEVGGFLDIGDTHVAVPWKEVVIKNQGITLPITEDNVEDYSLFKEQFFSRHDVGEITTVEEDLDTGPDIWKATSLLNDYAVLEGNVGYGYVDDLIFNENAELESVVISAATPDYGYGYYAYPWYGYGYGAYAWDPDLDHYVLPYSADEIAAL